MSNFGSSEGSPIEDAKRTLVYLQRIKGTQQQKQQHTAAMLDSCSKKPQTASEVHRVQNLFLDQKRRERRLRERQLAERRAEQAPAATILSNSRLSHLTRPTSASNSRARATTPPSSTSAIRSTAFVPFSHVLTPRATSAGTSHADHFRYAHHHPTTCYSSIPSSINSSLVDVSKSSVGGVAQPFTSAAPELPPEDEMVFLQARMRFLEGKQRETERQRATRQREYFDSIKDPAGGPPLSVYEGGPVYDPTCRRTYRRLFSFRVHDAAVPLTTMGLSSGDPSTHGTRAAAGDAQVVSSELRAALVSLETPSGNYGTTGCDAEDSAAPAANTDSHASLPMYTFPSERQVSSTSRRATQNCDAAGSSSAAHLVDSAARSGSPTSKWVLDDAGQHPYTASVDGAASNADQSDFLFRLPPPAGTSSSLHTDTRGESPLRLPKAAASDGKPAATDAPRNIIDVNLVSHEDTERHSPGMSSPMHGSMSAAIATPRAAAGSAGVGALPVGAGVRSPSPRIRRSQVGFVDSPTGDTSPPLPSPGNTAPQPHTTAPVPRPHEQPRRHSTQLLEPEASFYRGHAYGVQGAATNDAKLIAAAAAATDDSMLSKEDWDAAAQLVIPTEFEASYRLLSTAQQRQMIRRCSTVRMKKAASAGE